MCTTNSQSLSVVVECVRRVVLGELRLRRFFMADFVCTNELAQAVTEIETSRVSAWLQHSWAANRLWGVKILYFM